jgi:hypothetical protein
MAAGAQIAQSEHREAVTINNNAEFVKSFAIAMSTNQIH